MKNDLSKPVVSPSACDDPQKTISDFMAVVRDVGSVAWDWGFDSLPYLTAMLAAEADRILIDMKEANEKKS